MFKIFSICINFLEILDPQLKYKFLLISLFISFGAFLEIITISSILPIVNIITLGSHSSDYNLSILNSLLNDEKINIPLFFLIFLFLSFLIRASILYININFSHSIGNKIIQRLSLILDSFDTIQLNNKVKERLLSTYLVKTDLIVSNIFFGLAQLISGIILVIFITIFLIRLDFFLAISVFSSISLFYFFTLKILKKGINRRSNNLELFISSFVKKVNEGLDSLRELLVFDSLVSYFDLIVKKDKKIRNIKVQNQFLSGLPRITLEFILISIFVVFLIINFDNPLLITNKLSIIATFAFAAQRILPSAQQVYGSYLSIKFGSKVFIEVFNLINQKKIEHELKSQNHQNMINNHNFSNKIHEGDLVISDLSFKYHDGKFIYHNFNYKFKRDQITGITGPSGSGKSTLVNLILGFYSPSIGKIKLGSNELKLLERKEWLNNFSYVPQKIYLFNDSIINNITLGKNIYSEDQLNKSIIASCLNDHYLSDITDLNFHVGSMGQNLSGGQRQRIGIARGLNKTSDVYIFDEATSAMDKELKLNIFRNIKKFCKNKVVIFISHDEDLLKLCDNILDINNYKNEI